MTVRLGPAWNDQLREPRRTGPDHAEPSSAQWRAIVPPVNTVHFNQLLAFADDVLAICQQIDVSPVLNGSLAVLAYTQQVDVVVDDIDLACSEIEFPQLAAALAQQGIDCELKPWHVLQARRGGLKVEFDATEHWLGGLSGRYRSLDTGRCVVKVVELDDLRELYGRGMRDLEGRVDDTSQAKLRHVQSRYELLAREVGRPYNSNVVVTSQSPTGMRVLLLHPSDIDGNHGDWGWVPPGGCREPGEDIAACAARELIEETGIDGVPDPIETEDVDVAIYRLDVPWGTPVQLSAEHTDHEWVSLDEISERCRPAALLNSMAKALHLP
jgi:8-oxo-dGTP pyrophosphatase MutT (NUDIX family)